MGGESFDYLKDAVELFFLGYENSKPEQNRALDIVGGDVLDAPIISKLSLFRTVLLAFFSQSSNLSKPSWLRTILFSSPKGGGRAIRPESLLKRFLRHHSPLLHVCYPTNAHFFRYPSIIR